MQELSFDPRDPVVEFEGWKLSLQIVTSENLYGITEPVEERSDGALSAVSSGLTWAGGQQRTDGSAAVRLRRSGEDEVMAQIEATAPEHIRCSKLIIRGLPDAALIGHRWQREPVRASGTTVHYPQTTHTPLIFLSQSGGTHIYFESLDNRVRAKRFTVVQRTDGITVELIHEDAATEQSRETHTPEWRIGHTRDPAAIVERHVAHVAEAFGLKPWQTRTDVPAWAREISLVVALHGMHWTGYRFNAYDDMRAALEYIAERIDGRRVLAFLPGWEGRYYWQYGDYRPEPLLGDARGFGKLASRARELGVKLMPMFGVNCVNKNLPGYDDWGAPAETRSPSGLVFQGNRPDWDTSRAHDPGWQAWLNPGAPSWRERLVEQVSALVKTYGLPAVFFDTTHVWINDPQHDLYTGLVALRDELKSRAPDLLITGEGWYDALGAVTPLSHTPGHLQHQWLELFTRYNRCFMHLSAGDPSRGSSGVHEAGCTPFAPAPDVPHMIPTLTVVDGTMESARVQVDAVIAQAKRYAASL